jgi:hypothetical protein
LDTGVGAGDGVGAGLGEGAGDGVGDGVGDGRGEGAGEAVGEGEGAWAFGDSLWIGPVATIGVLLSGTNSMRLGGAAFSALWPRDASAALPSAIISDEESPLSRKLEPQPERSKPLSAVPRSADVARRSAGLPRTLPA